MTVSALWQSVTRAPVVRDRKLVHVRLAELSAADAGLSLLLDHKPVAALLAGIANHAPYLWQLATQDPPRLRKLLESEPGTALRECLGAMREACGTAATDEAAMQALRLAKQEAALLIALADIGGVWDVVTVTHALSDFADAAVSSALRFLLREMTAAGKLTLAGPTDPGGRMRTGDTRAWQTWRARVELFQRRGFSRVFRSRNESRCRPDRRAACLCAHRQESRAPASGTHGRWLCAARRSAPSPRSRFHIDRHFPACRILVLRDRRAELGARRAHQGKAGRGREKAGARRSSANSRRLSGANISTMPPSPMCMR